MIFQWAEEEGLDSPQVMDLQQLALIKKNCERKVRMEYNVMFIKYDLNKNTFPGHLHFNYDKSTFCCKLCVDPKVQKHNNKQSATNDLTY